LTGEPDTERTVVCHLVHHILEGAHAASQELLTTADADFMQPAARRNEVLAWVKAGLRDFSISRAAVEWGIRIPRDTSQTVYVWCVRMGPL
jgi:methionyl-tRNA synthetase